MGRVLFQGGQPVKPPQPKAGGFTHRFPSANALRLLGSCLLLGRREDSNLVLPPPASCSRRDHRLRSTNFELASADVPDYGSRGRVIPVDRLGGILIKSRPHFPDAPARTDVGWARAGKIGQFSQQVVVWQCRAPLFVYRYWSPSSPPV